VSLARPLTNLQLENFVAELAAAQERWRPFVRHADDVRVYEQVWNDAQVNAWLICWSHDQDTGFHDHHHSAAAIRVISGAVREERLRLGSAPRSRIAHAGETLTVPPVAIHRVLHAGDVPAITLHAYSPPLLCTGAYRVGPDGVLERELMSLEDELRASSARSA
jgi:mannose-6-phosphate isomerase-like protein (cupin superfamily)